MVTTAVCKMCGKLFTKKGHSQKYCCEECRRAAIRREQRKRYLEWVKPQNEKKKRQCAPSITMEGMVDIMLKLEKKFGRIVQYGEVQRMLRTGKLKVKDGKVLYENG